jgi:hypothetical protein
VVEDWSEETTHTLQRLGRQGTAELRTVLVYDVQRDVISQPVASHEAVSGLSGVD